MKTQERILSEYFIIKANGIIHIDSLANILNVNPSTVDKDIKIFKDGMKGYSVKQTTLDAYTIDYDNFKQKWVMIPSKPVLTDRIPTPCKARLRTLLMLRLIENNVSMSKLEFAELFKKHPDSIKRSINSIEIYLSEHINDNNCPYQELIKLDEAPYYQLIKKR